MLGSSKRRNSLPYYKDKPFSRAGRSPLDGLRLPRWMLQRRTVALVLGSLALLSWWFGILSPLGFASRRVRGDSAVRPSTPTKAKAKGGSSWFSSGEKIDWDQRAGMVRDTFKLSFAGYEKYGWGMSDRWR
jgi:mannosyl-oligosaccharide alpha-1,2-mannosidase